MGASYGLTAKIVSLSVRRAWIEIINEVYANFDGFCRSPQGERG